MNEIIYSSINFDDNLAAKNETEIVQSIFDQTDQIFSIVQPRKLLYMAVDGVAPRAKLNTQRTRRFLEEKDAREKSEKVKQRLLIIIIV